jgi:hypothetical protein
MHNPRPRNTRNDVRNSFHISFAFFADEAPQQPVRLARHSEPSTREHSPTEVRSPSVDTRCDIAPANHASTGYAELKFRDDPSLLPIPAYVPQIPTEVDGVFIGRVVGTLNTGGIGSDGEQHHYSSYSLNR